MSYEVIISDQEMPTWDKREDFTQEAARGKDLNPPTITAT